MSKIREALEKWQAGPEKEFKLALDFADVCIGNKKASEMDVGTLVGFYGGFEAKEAETCEWRKEGDSYWITECTYDADHIDGYYCPYCGGKIVEKENKG